ncbi:Aldehyde/histidinol dehydrogenase [Mycena olivaceomarginata]|nr:Aldehyde/histidinol dehydrogenase [Mycena olivaceomarginata]
MATSTMPLRPPSSANSAHGADVRLRQPHLRPFFRLDAEFASRLAEEVASFKVGNGLDSPPPHGPLIHARALEKVQAHVDDAVKLDAQVLVGGTSIPGTAFFNPTVLSDIPTSARINSEENTEEEVIKLANSTDVGLTGYSAAAFLALLHTPSATCSNCALAQLWTCGSWRGGYACPAVDVRVLACGYARPAGDVGVSGVRVCTSSWGTCRVSAYRYARPAGDIGSSVCGYTCPAGDVGGYARLAGDVRVSVCRYARPTVDVRVSAVRYAHPVGDVRVRMSGWRGAGLGVRVCTSGWGRAVCTSSCERAGLGVQYLKGTDQFDSSFTTSYKASW